MNDNKTVYKLCPCPAYDIEGVESFLTSMANEGLILKHDGFFAGVFSFEKSQAKLTYRLEAITENPSIWSDNMGEPDSETVETSKELGWEYITKFHDFHIYASENAEKRELNTDLEVQAIAINEVKKRQLSAVSFAVIWFIIYPLIHLKYGLFLAIIEMGSVLFAVVAVAITYCVCGSLASYIHLAKLKKRLQSGEYINHSKDWKSGKLKYFLAMFSKVIATVFLICVMFGIVGGVISDVGKEKISLQDYNGEFKFATLADFAGENHSYSPKDMFGESNTIYEWSDVISPYNAEYEETAYIITSDGVDLTGSLYIDYHETTSEWLAEKVAKEYYKQAKSKDDFEEIEIYNSQADYIKACTEIYFLETVIIQKGNQVIKASYFPHSNSSEVNFYDWVDIVIAKLE